MKLTPEEETAAYEALKKLYDQGLCSQCQKKIEEGKTEVTVVISSAGNTISMLRTCSPYCLSLIAVKGYLFVQELGRENAG